MWNFTKFGLDKYVENKELNNTINDIIIDKKLESNKAINNSWLINSKNSCRYDFFITLYGFCIKESLYKDNYNFNNIFNTLNIIFDDLTEIQKVNWNFLYGIFLSK